MQYRILHDSSAPDLELTVNTWIGLGWTPLGGVSAFKAMHLQREPAPNPVASRAEEVSD